MQPSAESAVSLQRLIPTHEETDLSWYFGPGAAYFEKSMFGVMLEHQSMFGQVSERCVTCSPEMPGVLADGKWCPDCKGTGHTRSRVPLRVTARMYSTAACGVCSGTGIVGFGEPCQRCDGCGYAQSVTADLNDDQEEEAGWAPDDEVLVRYARVSRRLDMLTEEAFEVLRLYYGDRGSRWAGEVVGRIMALYPMTPAGAKLAKRGITEEMRKTLGELGLRLDEAIWNEFEEQRQNPNETRRKQLEATRKQADDLLDRAAEEWRGTARK